MRNVQTVPRNRRGEAEVGGVVNALFHRWPALLGFSVQDEGELFLAEVAVHPWIDEQERSKLCYDIAVAFSELIDEQPVARELVSGRTFARALH
jgi:hypothetical protein